MNEKANNEIKHGEYLASEDTEKLWGWGTPAGKIRADKRAKMISEGAKLNLHSHVLEIGCGTGMFTEMFAKSDATIIAVDISERLLEKAKKRNLPESKVKFLQKRFEDCNVDGPFDAVIGSSVLHHLDIKTALSKIFSLLKTKGVISFAEPNILNPQIFMERNFRSFFPYISPDETAFNRKKLKKLLSNIGFSDIEIIPFDWLHPSTPEILIPTIKTIGNFFESLPIIKEFSGSLYIKAIKK